MVLYLFIGLIVLGLVVFVVSSLMAIQKSKSEMHDLAKWATYFIIEEGKQRRPSIRRSFFYTITKKLNLSRYKILL